MTSVPRAENQQAANYMSSAYERVNTGSGRLKIGGREVDLKKKKKKRKRDQAGDQQADSGVVKGEPGPDEPILEAKPGTGRITSSGQIVTGYETQFLKELKVNDALIITHPTTFAEETRIVKVIVSNSGMSISSGFSTDLISTTTFKYIRPPSDETVEDPEISKNKKALDEENQAFGTYSSGGGSKMVYRVKKPGVYGGYRIVSEDLNSSLSRTELLEMRSKHKSDRHAG